MEFYQSGGGTSQSNFSSCFPLLSDEEAAEAGRRAVVVGVGGEGGEGGGAVGHGSGAWLKLLSAMSSSVYMAGRMRGWPSDI